MISLLQQLQLRQTILQKLGLESEYLDSCLKREQRQLTLLRGLVDESKFRSVLDWILAIYIPAYADSIHAYYEGEGKRLIEARPWGAIDAIDRLLDEEMVRLGALHREIWTLGLHARDEEARMLVDAYLEGLARPKFARVA